MNAWTFFRFSRNTLARPAGWTTNVAFIRLMSLAWKITRPVRALRTDQQLLWRFLYTSTLMLSTSYLITLVAGLATSFAG